MSVSSGEDHRLEDFITSLAILKKSIDKILQKNSHFALSDALEYIKAVSPEISKEIELIPKKIENSMIKVMSKATEEPVGDVRGLDNALLDCFEVIDRCLDTMAGRASAFVPNVSPRRKFEFGPVEAPNILYPSDRTVFSRDSNPFEKAIDSLSFEKYCVDNELYSGSVYPESVASVPCKLIETEHELDEMVQRLENEPVIGIDLENHSYYSYHGFCCLIQISSHDTDYIVDAIKLKTELRSCLPKILSNPHILKILHGAEHDILWLQRDFDCFLVCVFDTFIAAKQLRMEKKSLSGLLQSYFGLNLDKQYQLADWRVRPLPDEMLRYARLDTHYLLPLFAKMKKQVISSLGVEALHQTFRGSSQQCLKLFSPHQESENNQEAKCKSLLVKSNSALDSTQAKIVREICKWRTKKAQKHDVSLHAVLSNRSILRLATCRPNSVNDLKKLLQSSYTHFADEHSLELIELVQDKQETSSAKQPKFESIAPKLVKPFVSIAAPNAVSPFSSIMRPSSICSNYVSIVPEPVALITPNEETTEDSGANVALEDQEDKAIIDDKLLNIIESTQFSMNKISKRARKPMAIRGDMDISEKASSLYDHGARSAASSKAQKLKGTDSAINKHLRRKKNDKGQYITSQIQKNK